MSSKWQAFRIICILHLTLMFYFLAATVSQLFFRSTGILTLTIMLQLLIIALPAFALTLLSRNYPDMPVVGAQKTTFNWLYLLNFLMIAVLFAWIFSSFTYLRFLRQTLNIEPPIQFVTRAYLQIVGLVLHCLVLAGLFLLRRELLNNRGKDKFEFET